MSPKNVPNDECQLAGDAQIALVASSISPCRQLAWIRQSTLCNRAGHLCHIERRCYPTTLVQRRSVRLPRKIPQELQTGYLSCRRFELSVRDKLLLVTGSIAVTQKFFSQDLARGLARVLRRSKNSMPGCDRPDTED